MPEDMPEDMPDRMPEDMSEYMPEDMPVRMPDRMPEDMSDRMPQDLSVRKCINVMVGITRSKVIGLKMGYTPKRNGHRHQLNRAEAAAQVSLPRPIGHAQPEVEGLEQ